MRIIGVDPGAHGAFAVVDGLKLLQVVDMPVQMVRRGKTDKAEVDFRLLDLMLREAANHEDVIVVFEQVGGITGQSASAAFNFGRSVGLAEGAVRNLASRLEFVAPQTWKKEFRLSGAKNDSRVAARRLWPTWDSTFARVKDDGRAEAALIAEWGRRKFGGSNGVFD